MLPVDYEFISESFSFSADEYARLEALKTPAERAADEAEHEAAPHGRCDTCRQPVTLDAVVQTTYAVSSTGIEGTTVRSRFFIHKRFCGEACRRAHRCLPGPARGFTPVRDPGDHRVHPCPECVTLDERLGLVALIALLNELGVSEPERQPQRALDELVATYGESETCLHCRGLRWVRRTPDFWYSDPSSAHWDPRWAGHNFDQLLGLYVFDWDRRDNPWQTYDREAFAALVAQGLSPVEVALRVPTKINFATLVEAYLFSTPHEANAWWAEGDTMEAVDELRATFRAQRAEAQLAAAAARSAA